jgi:hypothetical protein
MGLLNDLQSQVDKIKDEEARKNADLREQEAYYDEHLKPVMIRAHDYFSEIVENLNIVLPEIYPVYSLNPMDRNGVTLKQDNYLFNADNARHPRQIDVLTICNLEKSVEFYVPTKEGASIHSDLLQSYQFPHHRKNKLDKLHEICGATFLLEGPMRAHIKISANPAEKCIYILLRNLENQPVKSYKFSPERVDESLLERLARMLIREESLLVEVKVCDKVREDLKRKVEQEKQQREHDLAEAYAQIESEKLEAENAKLINRTTRAVAKKNKRFFERISKKLRLDRSS